jgi:hypothetical protein
MHGPLNVKFKLCSFATRPTNDGGFVLWFRFVSSVEYVEYEVDRWCTGSLLRPCHWGSLGELELRGFPKYFFVVNRVP